MENKTSISAPALQRGLQILELLKDGNSRSLEEITKELQHPKSSVIRLLETLTSMMYVEREETTRKYRTKVALYPLAQRHSRFRKTIQECLEELSEKLNMTIEWFTPHKEHMLLTQRCENSTSSVRIKAQLGHCRVYWGEFDAVARIAQKALVLKGNKKEMAKCWEYKGGDKRQVDPKKIVKGVASVKDDLIAFDNEYNANGIRRMAIGIRDTDNSLFGILSIPEHFHPKAEAMRTERLDLMRQRGKALQKKLKEI